MSAKLLKSAVLNGIYEQDFVRWCEETARLLRAGHFAQVDVENLIEEVEAMAGRDKRELRSRLTVLLQHLLKWEQQPAKRSGSWLATILTQRQELKILLEQSPSLQDALAGSMGKAYADAVKNAARESGLAASVFSPQCRYRLDQIMDDDFWPGQG